MFKKGVLAVCMLTFYVAVATREQKSVTKDSKGPQDGEGSCECGISENPDAVTQFGVRIIGGEEVKPSNKYPWMVALKIKEHGAVGCGGSIISPLYVLTAAHCFLRDDYIKAIDPEFQKCVTATGKEGPCFYEASDIEISYQAGQQLLSRNVDVSSRVVHEEYDLEKFLNDIALIKVKEPFPCDVSTRPICLPKNVPDMEPDQNVVVSGWGATENSEGSDILLEATIQIKRCSRYPTHICAQSPNKGSCFGDSGGPAFAPVEKKFYVFGVTSFGDANCDKEVPAAYSKVKNFIDWISANMEGSI